MIHYQDDETTRVPSPRFQPRVIRGAAVLDLERFAGALRMLEDYVDGMLAGAELAPMDSWVEDEVMDARLASL